MSKLEDVQHRFEWDATNFDAIYSSDTLPTRWFNRLFRKAIFVRYDTAMSEAGDVAGKAVLDIGCGSGVYSTEFAKRGARRVLGIDFSAPMLEIARASAKRMNLEASTDFVQAEFLSHDFKDEKFDVSIAMGVFDYLEQALPLLTKMASVTRGKVIASFPKYSLVRGTARRLRYRLTKRGDVFYYEPREVDQLAERAGLKRHKLIHMGSSGGGVVLVGDNS
ncbi:MAG: class I SAM-dependent methyltransferase [Deltaproteobacteria bacterium]|nr:class I SAM-dependent methyltransferase [Deltaproteobacteria bacterium]